MPDTSEITYDQFAAVDIRVGKIIQAEVPSWSKKLLKLTVTFGESQENRTLFSGIQTWYSPEELIDKQFPFITNMAPKKMGEEFSQGMMLMADTADRPILIEVPESIAPGTIIR